MRQHNPVQDWPNGASTVVRSAAKTAALFQNNTAGTTETLHKSLSCGEVIKLLRGTPKHGPDAGQRQRLPAPDRRSGPAAPEQVLAWWKIALLA